MMPGTFKKTLCAGICALCLILFSLGALRSQEIDDSPSFRVHLRMDRFSFNDDEAIKLQVCVQNNAFRREYYKSYDMDYITFQPVVYNSAGREAEILVPHRLANISTDEAVKGRDPRIIALGRNEIMTHVIDLRKIYKLDGHDEYRVKVFFVPDPGKQYAVPGDNILRFKVSRSDVFTAWGKGPIREPRRDRTEFSISPREVVMLFLTAEKERNWENHLKYIRMDGYINSFPNYGKLYNAADDSEKLKIEDEFINFLKSDRGDYIIDFSVDRENIVQGKGIAYVDSHVQQVRSALQLQV